MVSEPAVARISTESPSCGVEFGFQFRLSFQDVWSPAPVHVYVVAAYDASGEASTITADAMARATATSARNALVEGNRAGRVGSGEFTGCLLGLGAARGGDGLSAARVPEERSRGGQIPVADKPGAVPRDRL
jgi:hypothetical protein